MLCFVVLLFPLGFIGICIEYSLSWSSMGVNGLVFVVLMFPFGFYWYLQ